MKNSCHDWFIGHTSRHDSVIEIAKRSSEVNPLRVERVFQHQSLFSLGESGSRSKKKEPLSKVNWQEGFYNRAEGLTCFGNERTKNKGEGGAGGAREEKK